MKQNVYLGTYTDGPLHFPKAGSLASRGIHFAVFDTETGLFEQIESATETPNPSWLAFHPTLPVLYSVNETPLEGFRGGGLSVFRCDSPDGRLAPAGLFDTMGSAPCHLVVESEGRFLVVSNYRSGNFTLFRLDESGIPFEEPIVFQSSGSGPNPRRQEGPHGHSASIDPRTGDIQMIDLGTDTIYVRSFDEPSMSFSNRADHDLKMPSGCGCRHGVFSPDAEALYVIGELDLTIRVFLREERKRFGRPVQTVSLLSSLSPPDDADFTRKSSQTASAIDLHPSGMFLLASIRGREGSVQVFGINESSRCLERIEHLKTNCRIPRFCRWSPCGNFLIVCGQDTATVESYRIDPHSGKLRPTEGIAVVDSPVCVVWQS